MRCESNFNDNYRLGGGVYSNQLATLLAVGIVGTEVIDM